ncbi:MAG: protein phosphatase 2C domain-containing protein [Paracoccaceae bacterium]
MQSTGELGYDTATVISQGRRERQEDAVISDFPTGSGMGFVVLADGMGGHSAGDVASKIVVTEVFSELKLQTGDIEAMERNIGDILRGAAFGANECVGLYSAEKSDDHLMGATLLAPVLIGDRLFWISVGDSPLYLMRDGALTRLNDDHAVGSQVEYLVASGLMRRDEAVNHPEPNSLTSVLVGQDIPQIDCPAEPFRLAAGDILIAASDGLLVLSDEQIARTLRPLRDSSAEAIGAALMGAIEAADDPHQDNVTLGIVKVQDRAVPGRASIGDALQPKVLRRDLGGVTIVAKVSNRAASAAG